MDILGVGPMEFLFIVILAILFIGPKDMSKTARSAGRFLNRLYRSETWRSINQASRTLQNLPNQLAREAALEDLDAVRKDLEDTGKALQSEVGTHPVLKPWVTPYDMPGSEPKIAPPTASAAASAETPSSGRKGKTGGKPTTAKASPPRPTKSASKKRTAAGSKSKAGRAPKPAPKPGPKRAKPARSKAKASGTRTSSAAKGKKKAPTSKPKSAGRKSTTGTR